MTSQRTRSAAKFSVKESYNYPNMTIYHVIRVKFRLRDRWKQLTSLFSAACRSWCMIFSRASRCISISSSFSFRLNSWIHSDVPHCVRDTIHMEMNTVRIWIESPEFVIVVYTPISKQKYFLFITLLAPYQTDFGTNTEIQYFFRICRLRHTQIEHVFRHFLFVKGW